MTKSISVIALLLFTVVWATGFSQQKPAAAKPRVEVFYFHPTERCPIDQSIEDNTRKLMQTTYARQVKEGTILLKIINTDDKSQAKTVSRFDINTQALYLVSTQGGKEVKNDLTHFAFSLGLSNPVRFKSELKDEIDKLLK